MQVIREHAEALYDNMENNIKLFKRESYEDNFTEYRDKNHLVFQEITSVLRSCEEEAQVEPLKEICKCIVDAAMKRREAVSGRIAKENEQLNLNMITVVYVLPAIRAIKEKRAEELSELLCMEWAAAFKGSNIKASDFQSIQGGFKTKLCYVTTAVCKNLKKPDNCYELRLLKQYRDEYLAQAEGGEELIHNYYDIAPTIVKRIDKDADAEGKYRFIWETYLKPCVELIEAGKNEACRELYVEMVKKLQREYMEDYYG
ncbi:MAG: hypothetical protein GX234_05070 [Clostridiales bacterium]|nr:hypothetical protein [Clostridiales bacterium]